MASPLPVHFVTIVLNGQPFVRHQAETFAKLSFPWHWHVVEGVAALAHDTAWSKKTGGHIAPAIHKDGLSVDGTTEALDEIAKASGGRVTVYRKPRGEFWDGKIEMFRAPLSSMRRECLLWEVDIDEIWTADQIARARDLFLENPDRRAAFYRCVYFVGPDLVISTRDGYGNGSYEWLRTWRYRPGNRWLAHEPPILATRWEWLRQWKRRRKGMSPKATFGPEDPRVFTKAQTEAQGLVFQHLAYVLESQVQFKETYYGYRDAVSKWKAMQTATKFPLRLADHFPWVTDETTIDRASASGRGIVPLIPFPPPV